MAGLDFLSSDEAQLGLAMLAAAGPTPYNMSFGQRLAGAMQQAQSGKDSREERAMKRMLMESQVAQNRAETAQKTALAGELNGLLGGGAPPVGLLAGPPGAAPGLLADAPASAVPGGPAPAGNGGAPQPGGLRGIPLSRVTRLKALGGPDLTKQWELENIGTPMQPGWIRMADGTMSYTGNPEKGIGSDGRLLPSFINDQAALTAATEAAKTREGARFQDGPVVIDMDPNSPTYKQKVQRSRFETYGGGASAAPAPAPAPGPRRALIGPGATGVRGNFTGTAEEIMAQIDASPVSQAVKNEMRQAYANQVTGNNPAFDPMGTGAAPPPAGPLIGPGAGAPRAPAANVVELSPDEQARDAARKEAESGQVKSDQGRVDEWIKGADAGRGMVQTAQRLRSIAASGIYEGGTAQAKTQIASIIGGLTGITPKALPGSEEFNAEASNLVLGQIKALGANPSNADREFILRTIPQITNSPQAREALLQYMEEKGTKAMELGRRADAYWRQNKTLGGFEPYPSAPPPPPAPPPASRGTPAPPAATREFRGRVGEPGSSAAPAPAWTPPAGWTVRAK